MKLQTKALRDAVKHIEGSWVRVWRDGEMWAGSKRQSQAAIIKVKTALEAAGFYCECNGAPGTSGEYVINVRAVSKSDHCAMRNHVMHCLRTI